MVDFLALVTNPNIFNQFPHTVLAGLVTSAFFIMGISAYHMLRGSHPEIFRPSMRLGIITGLLATVLVIITGHISGLHMTQVQPMKIAAANAQWETASYAPLNLVAWIDQQQEKNSMVLAIPALESFLAHNSFSAEVKGIKDIQREMEARFGPGYYVPPVALTFWSFRIMVAAGFWMLFLVLYAYYLERKGKLESSPGVLKALLYTIPVPYIANTCGWIMAEVGAPALDSLWPAAHRRGPIAMRHQRPAPDNPCRVYPGIGYPGGGGRVASGPFRPRGTCNRT